MFGQTIERALFTLLVAPTTPRHLFHTAATFFAHDTLNNRPEWEHEPTTCSCPQHYTVHAIPAHLSILATHTTHALCLQLAIRFASFSHLALNTKYNVHTQTNTHTHTHTLARVRAQPSASLQTNAHRLGLHIRSIAPTPVRI